MKKFLALVLSGAVALAASGCSTAAVIVANSATPTPAPTATPAPTEEPTPAPTGEPEAEESEGSISPLVPQEGAPVQIYITEENYQSLFDYAVDYNYLGIAYFKVPNEDDAFTDAYLPYGNLQYSDDGTVVSGTAHGVQVTATIVRLEATATAEDALPALQALHAEALEAEGVSPDGIYGDVQYDKSYDIAIQPAAYTTADGSLRLSLLYADTRYDGDYYCAIITMRTEEFDDATPGVLTEIADAFAITLPDMESILNLTGA